MRPLSPQGQRYAIAAVNYNQGGGPSRQILTLQQFAVPVSIAFLLSFSICVFFFSSFIFFQGQIFV